MGRVYGNLRGYPHTIGMKELYGKRKETIERNFGTAKEHHAMRYTQLIGKKKMGMKVGLTFACMNMKKLVNLLSKRDGDTSLKRKFRYLFASFKINLPKMDSIYA